MLCTGSVALTILTACGEPPSAPEEELRAWVAAGVEAAEKKVHGAEHQVLLLASCAAKAKAEAGKLEMEHQKKSDELVALQSDLVNIQSQHMSLQRPCSEHFPPKTKKDKSGDATAPAAGAPVAAAGAPAQDSCCAAATSPAETDRKQLAAMLEAMAALSGRRRVQQDDFEMQDLHSLYGEKVEELDKAAAQRSLDSLLARKRDMEKVCTDFLQREQALTKRLRVLESSGQEAKQQVEEAAARQAAGLQGTPIALSSADGVFPQSFPSRC